MLFPGIKELLKDIEGEGAVVTLYTGGGRESTRFCMEAQSVLTYFDRVITGDDVLRHKPHPEGILKLMQDFQLSPRKTLVVGDAGADILAGQEAGAVTVLARWSGYALPFDLQSEPDQIFYSVSDFRKFVFE